MNYWDKFSYAQKGGRIGLIVGIVIYCFWLIYMSLFFKSITGKGCELGFLKCFIGSIGLTLLWLPYTYMVIIILIVSTGVGASIGYALERKKKNNIEPLKKE